MYHTPMFKNTFNWEKRVLIAKTNKTSSKTASNNNGIILYSSKTQLYVNFITSNPQTIPPQWIGAYIKDKKDKCSLNIHH